MLNLCALYGKINSVEPEALLVPVLVLFRSFHDNKAILKYRQKKTAPASENNVTPFIPRPEICLHSFFRGYRNPILDHLRGKFFRELVKIKLSNCVVARYKHENIFAFNNMLINCLNVILETIMNIAKKKGLSFNIIWLFVTTW